MNNELDELLQRWREGRLDGDGLGRLAKALDHPGNRAALRAEWFLETALPAALQAAPALLLFPPPSNTPPRRPSRNWTAAHWGSLAAAAAITLACFLWERSASRTDDLESFATRLAAATLEP